MEIITPNLKTLENQVKQHRQSAWTSVLETCDRSEEIIFPVVGIFLGCHRMFLLQHPGIQDVL